METVRSLEQMRERARTWRRAGRVVGLVPTMGCLHEGHLSLMRLARRRCDVLVASVFVNPAQFGPQEDLASYPRDFARDAALCRAEGADLLFHPDAEGMYAADASAWVDEQALSAGLCGASRPGHFRGVCTVVAKLFNLVQPTLAVFGEKDAQQLRIVERMVRDLDFPVEIVRGPIVREPDGLAMSSRNRHLDAAQRREAACLHRALEAARALAAAGRRDVAGLRQAMEGCIAAAPSARIDYIAFVDDATLAPVEVLSGRTLVALAVRIGPTRLIDNAVVLS